MQTKDSLSQRFAKCIGSTINNKRPFAIIHPVYLAMLRFSRTAFRAASRAVSTPPVRPSSNAFVKAFSSRISGAPQVRLAPRLVTLSRSYASDAEDATLPPAEDAEKAAEERRSLYVGNLSWAVTSDILQQEFSKFGELERVDMPHNDRGLSRGFGYVWFNSADDAEQAMAALNHTILEGRMMNLEFARRQVLRHKVDAPKNPPSRTLYIGNMSHGMSDKDLNELFSSIKNVMDVRVAMDRRTGVPRGFAHADFTDEASAVAAAELIEGQEFHGRKLRVDYSTTTRNG